MRKIFSFSIIFKTVYSQAENSCSFRDWYDFASGAVGARSFSIIVRTNDAPITSAINPRTIGKIDLFPVCNRYFTAGTISLLYAHFRGDERARDVRHVRTVDLGLMGAGVNYFNCVLCDPITRIAIPFRQFTVMHVVGIVDIFLGFYRAYASISKTSILICNGSRSSKV